MNVYGIGRRFLAAAPLHRRGKAMAKIMTRNIHVEKRIEDLGLSLPATATPKGSYVQFNRMGNVVFTAGHISAQHDGTLITGKVGADISPEEGHAAAKQVALSLIATMQNAAGGDLDKVKKIVKLVGFVNCDDSFGQQPEVINGCSNLMGEVFGEERAAHARSAVGTNSLPRGVPVEIELIAEIKD